MNRNTLLNNQFLFSDIFFDLDGTLVDSLPGIEYSFRKALKTVFPEKKAPSIAHLIGPHIRDIFTQAIGEDIDTSELDALEIAYRSSYDTDGCLLTTTFPDVEKTLARIKRSGIQCHIVTNKPFISTKAILSHLELTPLFGEIVCRDSRSPSFRSKTESVEHLATKLSNSKRDILFVGDSCDDALAALTNGFPFAAADYGYGAVSQRLPDHIAFRLPNFASLLNCLSLNNKHIDK